jgi:hypothetical protein
MTKKTGSGIYAMQQRKARINFVLKVIEESEEKQAWEDDLFAFILDNTSYSSTKLNEYIQELIDGRKITVVKKTEKGNRLLKVRETKKLIAKPVFSEETKKRIIDEFNE